MKTSSSDEINRSFLFELSKSKFKLFGLISGFLLGFLSQFLVPEEYTSEILLSIGHIQTKHLESPKILLKRIQVPGFLTTVPAHCKKTEIETEISNPNFKGKGNLNGRLIIDESGSVAISLKISGKDPDFLSSVLNCVFEQIKFDHFALISSKTEIINQKIKENNEKIEQYRMDSKKLIDQVNKNSNQLKELGELYQAIASFSKAIDKRQENNFELIEEITFPQMEMSKQIYSISTTRHSKAAYKILLTILGGGLGFFGAILIGKMRLLNIT